MTESSGLPAASGEYSLRGSLGRYVSGYASLKGNEKSYWTAQVVNLLDQLAYSATIIVAVVFLSSELGWDDVRAGYGITLFTMGITVSLFFSGIVTDLLGVRRSLMVSMLLSGITRLVILFCGLSADFPGRDALVLVALCLASPAVAMSTTTFQTINKHYSTSQSRGASFSIYFLVVNFASVVAGLAVDYTRLQLELNNSYIFGFSAIAFLLAFVVAALFVRDRTLVTDVENAKGEVAAGVQLALQQVRSVFSTPTFWWYILFVSSLLGVRSVFVYAFLILPKFWIRVLGEDAPIGALYAVNPAVILIGTLLVIPITHRFRAYPMVLLGSTISALSLIFLAMPHQWFGDDFQRSFLIMSILMMVTMSIGEVIWSPKLMQFTAEIAPAGQEGSYFGLSMIPWFFAKLVVSALSGHMLARWVPVDVARGIGDGTLAYTDSPEFMFLLLLFWAVTGPLVLFFFRRILEGKMRAAEQ